MFLKTIVLLAVVIGGVTAGLQATMNADLSRRVGSLESAFVTFLGGAVILGVLVALFGTGQLHRIADAPRWQLTGGLMGVIIMASLITGVGRLGATPAIIASIAGQVLLGIIVDHYGLLGVVRTPFSWWRAVGVALMIVSLLVIFRPAPGSSGT